MSFTVTHYYLKREERPGDVFGPMAVTVVEGTFRKKYLEYRMRGPHIVEHWLLPLGVMPE